MQSTCKRTSRAILCVGIRTHILGACQEHHDVNVRTAAGPAARALELSRCRVRVGIRAIDQRVCRLRSRPSRPQAQ